MLPVDRRRTTIVINRDIYALLKAVLEVNEITMSAWVEEKAKAYIAQSMTPIPSINQIT
jgi:hypothetical protein